MSRQLADMFPGSVIIPEAHRVIRAGDLFDEGGYEVFPNFHGYGAQATFDIPARTDPTQGLRVTVGSAPTGSTAGVFAGQISAGLPVTITQVNGDAVAAAFDTTAANATYGAITGNVQDATTLATYKAIIDAVDGLDSDYFGGETGTSMAGSVDGVTVGTEVDETVYMRLHHNGDIFLFIGRDAPSDDTGSVQVQNGATNGLILWEIPAGKAAWFHGVGNSDVAGAVQMWYSSRLIR